VYDGNAKLTRS